MRSIRIIGEGRPSAVPPVRFAAWTGVVEQDRSARAWAAVRDAAAQEHATVSVRHAVIACARMLSAEGAGLSMARDAGPREPVLATGPLIEELEELQFTLGQAPCGDVTSTSGPVLVPDLAEPYAGRRWPVFAPAAVERGMRAMFVFPVALGAAMVGVLSVYRPAAGALSRAEIDDGLWFADIVLALALDDQGGIAPGMKALLDIAIDSRRAEVHQAAGAIAAQLDVSVTDALTRLRAYAYLSGRRVSDVAADVMAGRLRMDHDPGPMGDGEGPGPAEPKEER